MNEPGTSRVVGQMAVALTLCVRKAEWQVDVAIARTHSILGARLAPMCWAIRKSG